MYYLWIISGGDVDIIEKCNAKTRNQFLLIGLTVFLVLVSCFISSWFSINSLFHNHYFAAFFATFFALLIFNIYLLIQTTISRDFLPTNHIINSKRKFGKLFSLFIRLGFVIFIAILVSKPIEEYMFSDKLEQSIQVYKEQLKKKYELKSLSIYSSEESRVLSKIARVIQIQRLGLHDYSQELNFLQVELNSIKLKMDSERERVRLLVDNSDFFIQKIKMLARNHPSSWIITILFTVIFMLPIYFKYKISSGDSEYYYKKSLTDRNLIVNNYSLFKEYYHKTFLCVTGKKINFEERYTEPPFNVTLITDNIEVEKEEALLDVLYCD